MSTKNGNSGSIFSLRHRQVHTEIYINAKRQLTLELHTYSAAVVLLFCWSLAPSLAAHQATPTTNHS